VLAAAFLLASATTPLTADSGLVSRSGDA
jgi:hypothetical protein